MSLYNMLFGQNPLSDIFLAMIGLRKEDTGRFRDCHIVKKADKIVIAVYTRNGGGNRAGYMPDFSEHPNYLYDVDDDFDNTYATIYFSVPDRFEKQISDFAVKSEMSASDKFQALIEKMESGDKDDPIVKNALNVGEQIMEKLTDAMEKK